MCAVGRIQTDRARGRLADPFFLPLNLIFRACRRCAPRNLPETWQTPADQSPSIRQLTAVDGRGLTTGENLGVVGNQADWRVSQQFDSSGWLLAQCVQQSGTCSVNRPLAVSDQPLDQRYRYDVYGNLKTQWHNGRWMSGGAPLAGAQGKHEYSYDLLHRLTQQKRVDASGSTTNPANTVNLSYDAIGNILKKTDYSVDSDTAYQYQSGSHRLSGVALPGGSASFTHDAAGNITQRNEPSGVTNITYDIDNLARRISRGANASEFYEAPGGRYLQRLTNGSSVRDTWMLEKTYEREVVNNTVTMERYYIAGQLLTIRPNADAAQRRKLSYLHTDRLGSPVSITEKALPAPFNGGTLGNAQTTLVEHRGFDPFGKAYDGQWGVSNNGWLTWNGSGFNQGKRNQRGFTGHEHLDEFQLIHMNGRMYDQNLGRFLGVDPFIQFPANSQSLNPYAYLMNNPLAGTDPTGYEKECADESDCVMTDAQRLTVYRDKVSGLFYAIADDGKDKIRVEAIQYEDENGNFVTLGLSQGLLQEIHALRGTVRSLGYQVASITAVPS
jgi:RHS repeat-associated protein